MTDEDFARMYLAEFMDRCVDMGDNLPDDLRAVMVLIEERRIVEPGDYGKGP